MTEHTGYPTVSGYEEFLYEPDKPLHGDLSDYAYNQRGAIAYVVELWDLFARLGLPRPKKFVDYYERLGRADMVKLAWWDRDENDGRVFRPWRAFRHPQLGDLEIGGLDPRVGIWNPPYREVAAMCAQQSQAFLRVAALAPSVRIGAIERTPVGSGVTRVEIRIENHGYLPTFVLASARRLDFNEPLHVDCEPDGCALIDPGQAHVVLGHLEGWGRGLHSGQNAPNYQRSSGNGHTARVVYLVRGTGALRLRIGSCRVGWRAETVAV
jgi:hypothetical protein